MTEPREQTRFLNRPQGRIAYEVHGRGPLVVLIPGMGDLRSTYRFLTPQLVAAGFQVATTDLRGHGDSDATFTEYGDEATAADVAALVAELGGPAVLIGNSMGAAAAVLVAAGQPDAITGVVLIGPFVREPEVGLLNRTLLRVAMARPWAARAWRAYLPSLFAGRKPEDLPEHLDAIAASVRRPGYARALHQTVRQTHHAVAERALVDVRAPALVIMGQQDPDWPDPQAEARWIGDTLSATVELVPDAGHYPQAQQPEITGRVVCHFAESVTERA